jgi:hypothetical protein
MESFEREHLLSFSEPWRKGRGKPNLIRRDVTLIGPSVSGTLNLLGFLGLSSEWRAVGVPFILGRDYSISIE